MSADHTEAETSDEDEVLRALERWETAERVFVAVAKVANERGMTWRAMSELTGIPTPTLHRWCRTPDGTKR